MTISEEDNEVRLYTTNQVAELCAVTPETVRNWIERGEIKAIRLNNQWRIRRPDLLTFLNSKYGA